MFLKQSCKLGKKELLFNWIKIVLSCFKLSIVDTEGIDMQQTKVNTELHSEEYKITLGLKKKFS